ncbi:glycerophosphodiester phosphodiesterase [Paenibacillus lutrae]|uniref:Glycerophosphodiester phosphodiesterase n=1 Tax=Paenibacillus lutrae TaxID=2078573 RepID=A0A7X3K0V8_9BACL|nr:glycerophosphodiester phosphodiesterase [Paenibacillus lutrae]MVP01644.1 glycerophosphodiester phosphodiesterase [Paenibacillus lutrae]
MKASKPIIIAHRGAKGLAPENKLGAFRLGLEQGCEAIELDIHLSADGELIVIHDATLDRTTDGQGEILAKSLAEIKAVDAGSWYSEAYKGETVPTLGEVFDLVPESVMINVELKVDGAIEQKLVDFVRERGCFGQVVVSCFDHKCLRRIKQMEPQIRIGLLYGNKMWDPVGYARSFDVDVYSLHPYHQIIEAEDVEKAIEHGLQVYPYTANTEEELHKLMAIHVSGIITNYPARLKELLDRNVNL